MKNKEGVLAILVILLLANSVYSQEYDKGGIFMVQIGLVLLAHQMAG
jgi:hypothetical protein